MIRNIHLHGVLAEQFQPCYALDVETPAEGLYAIMTQVKGFRQAIREGEFVCVRGDLDHGVDCDTDLLKLNFGSLKDFHIMPAAVGNKSGGGKILLGIALIGATLLSGGAALAAAGSLGAAVTGGTVAGGLTASIGAAWGGGLIGAIGGIGGLGLYTAGLGGLLILSGTSQALSTMPTGGDLNSVDEKPGYLFNGAINSAEQGGAVPLVFGRIRAGSVVVSAGVIAERLGSTGGSTVNPAPDEQILKIIRGLWGNKIGT